MDDSTFGNCTSLTKVQLPSTLEVIGMYVFSGCTALESITIPENVNKIGANAFQSCENLKEMYVLNENAPSTDFSFTDCNSLTRIYVPLGSEEKYEDFYDNFFSSEDPEIIGLGKYELRGYTQIPNSNVYYKVVDDTLYVDGSVADTAIPTHAFFASSGGIKLSNDVKNVILGENITSIGEWAFAYCKSIETIEMPNP